MPSRRSASRASKAASCNTIDVEGKSLELIPHRAKPTAVVRRVAANIRRTSAELAVTFRLEGDLARLRIPEWSGARIGSELWRHTCFEVFLARENEARYYEYNFAPSGEWALYELRDYRDGHLIANEKLAPHCAVRCTDDVLELDASIRPAVLSPAYARTRLCVGLSAVIEAEDGISYWAIRHPRAKPDFHDRAGFALPLDAPADSR